MNNLYLSLLGVLLVLHTALTIMFFRWLLYLARERRRGGNGVTGGLVILMVALVINELWSVYNVAIREWEIIFGQVDLTQALSPWNFVVRAVQLALFLAATIVVEKRFQDEGGSHNSHANEQDQEGVR